MTIVAALVLLVVSVFIASAATTPTTAASLRVPPWGPPENVAADAVPTSARVTVDAYRVCQPGVALRRIGVTCPCYFHWQLGAWAAGPTFNVTLSITEPGSDAAEAAAAAAAAEAVSANAVRPATPLRLPIGETVFVAYGNTTVFSHSVKVDLVITANFSLGEPGGIVCPGVVLLVLEPVEPTCPLRDIRLGGDGEVLGGGKGTQSRRLSVGHTASVEPPDGPAGPRDGRLEDTVGSAGGTAQGEARPPRTALATSVQAAPLLLMDAIEPRLWEEAPPAAPPPTVRVVGGTRLADPLTRSFVVLLRGPNSTCTGCLVAPRVVLTAAHCGVAPGHQVSTLPAVPHPAPHSAAATAAMRTVIVKRVVSHPDFSPIHLTADVAVVFLATDAPGYPSQPESGEGETPSSAFRPAAVNHDPAVPEVGSGVRVAGFGDQSQDWRTAYPDERSADVRVVSTAACREQQSGLRLGTTSDDVLRPAVHLCAGLDDGGCDACNGDSGGPLYQSAVTPDGRRLFILVGLISFSSGCAGPRQPTVYTRLSTYAGWIDGHVGGAGTAPPPGTTGGVRAEGATVVGGGPGSSPAADQSSPGDGGGGSGSGGGSGQTLAAALGAAGGIAVAVVATVGGVVMVRRRRRTIAAGMPTVAGAAGHGTPTAAAAAGVPLPQPPPPVATGAVGAAGPAGAEGGGSPA